MSVIPALAAPYAALVMDARTGEVLYEENADARLNPASLTKMMTLYITFQAIEHGEITLDTMVPISRNAASEPPSKLGLRAGQKIALRYLIRAAAIKSANDAATAIAEAIGGSVPAFAERMNATAKQLGMKNSHFVVPHGLTTPGHLSTARDMTILGRHLFYDFPQYYNIFSRRSADASIATVYNTNRRFLDAYKGADGIKTGYTAAAGFNLCASAQRGNERIIATIFGGKSTAWRNAKMADLMDLGFKRAPSNAPVSKPAVPAYIAENLPHSPNGVGRSLNLQMAVKESMRPQPRPGSPAATPAATLVAMQDGIDSALAAAQAPAEQPASAPALAAVEPEARPSDLVAAVSAAVDKAMPADQGIPVMAASASPMKPEARPDDLTTSTVALAAPATSASAETPVASEGEALASLDAEVADAAGTDTLGQAVAQATPGNNQMPVMIQTSQPQPETVALAQQMQNDPEADQAPPDRPDMIMLVSAQPGESPDPVTSVSPKLEVVSRASTSGGRHWGINLGGYNSPYAAERALLQTALTESSVLDGTLRKVVKTRVAYDATFVGMTEDMAQAACRRFEARGKECAVIGP